MVSPMLSTYHPLPFNSSDWIFEIKWDGYRCLAVKAGSCVSLFSRNGNKFKKFPCIERQLQAIPGDFVLDGEIVAYDPSGRLHFYHIGKPESVKQFIAFDILSLNNETLTKKPLIDRKEALQRLLSGQKEVKYCDYVLESGELVYKFAKDNFLEGMIAKKMDSGYCSGRSRDWLKIKNKEYCEAVKMQDRFKRE